MPMRSPRPCAANGTVRSFLEPWPRCAPTSRYLKTWSNCAGRAPLPLLQRWRGGCACLLPKKQLWSARRTPEQTYEMTLPEGSVSLQKKAGAPIFSMPARVPRYRWSARLGKKALARASTSSQPLTAAVGELNLIHGTEEFAGDVFDERPQAIGDVLLEVGGCAVGIER